MIAYLANLLGLSSRSPKWPAVRRAHLRRHGECAACGTTIDLEVHHLQPVHLYPDKELDPTNLITLCAFRGCHFRIGHAFDWQAFNLWCVEDAATQRERIERRAVA